MKWALLTRGRAHGERYVIFSGVCDDAGALGSPKPNALPPARSQRRDILASRADISPSPVGAFAHTRRPCRRSLSATIRHGIVLQYDGTGKTRLRWSSFRRCRTWYGSNTAT